MFSEEFMKLIKNFNFYSIIYTRILFKSNFIYGNMLTNFIL